MNERDEAALLELFNQHGKHTTRNDRPVWWISTQPGYADQEVSIRPDVLSPLDHLLIAIDAHYRTKYGKK